MNMFLDDIEHLLIHPNYDGGQLQKAYDGFTNTVVLNSCEFSSKYKTRFRSLQKLNTFSLSLPRCQGYHFRRYKAPCTRRPN